MNSMNEHAELRKLMARTVSDLLARDIPYAMAVPVVRSIEHDVRKKNQESMIQRLWALPAKWNYPNGMVVIYYLSDTSEVVALRDVTMNDKFTFWIHVVIEAEEHILSDLLVKLMEFRESHSLES